MKFKRRQRWNEGRSITKGRSRGGQIILKKLGGSPGSDTFLVRIGKDASRQVTGRPADARTALRALRGELEDGSYVPTRRTRFETFLEKAFLPHKRPGLKPKTYGGYVSIVETRLIPALGRHALQDLNQGLIQDWVDGMWAEELTSKTIREYFNFARAALNWAVIKGILLKNPAKGVELKPRSENWWLKDPFGNEDEDDGGEGYGSLAPSRVWTEEETRKFEAEADPEEEMSRWIGLGSKTGLRPQEESGLMWRHIDWESKRLQVDHAVIEVDKERRADLGKWVIGPAKTGRRAIALCPEAVKILRRQRKAVIAEGLTGERAAFVFPARSGPRPYNNPSNMKDRQRTFLKSRGFRYISPYGLRHTHATHLLRHGWTAFNVAKRLGCGIEMVFRHYGHLLPDHEKAELERLSQDKDREAQPA